MTVTLRVQSEVGNEFQWSVVSLNKNIEMTFSEANRQISMRWKQMTINYANPNLNANNDIFPHRDFEQPQSNQQGLMNVCVNWF